MKKTLKTNEKEEKYISSYILIGFPLIWPLLKVSLFYFWVCGWRIEQLLKSNLEFAHRSTAVGRSKLVRLHPDDFRLPLKSFLGYLRKPLRLTSIKINCQVHSIGLNELTTTYRYNREITCFSTEIWETYTMWRPRAIFLLFLHNFCHMSGLLVKKSYHVCRKGLAVYTKHFKGLEADPRKCS